MRVEFPSDTPTKKSPESAEFDPLEAATDDDAPGMDEAPVHRPGGRGKGKKEGIAIPQPLLDLLEVKLKRDRKAIKKAAELSGYTPMGLVGVVFLQGTVSNEKRLACVESMATILFGYEPGGRTILGKAIAQGLRETKEHFERTVLARNSKFQVVLKNGRGVLLRSTERPLMGHSTWEKFLSRVAREVWPASHAEHGATCTPDLADLLLVVANRVAAEDEFAIEIDEHDRYLDKIKSNF